MSGLRLYMEDIVKTWVGCASVLVHNKRRDWTFYTGEFGKESWQRVSDRTAKYEIGLHFTLGMLKADANAYKVRSYHNEWPPYKLINGARHTGIKPLSYC